MGKGERTPVIINDEGQEGDDLLTFVQLTMTTQAGFCALNFPPTKSTTVWPLLARH